MQVLQAGDRKLLLLELDIEILEGIARQLGYEVRLATDASRTITLDLDAANRTLPLLLFDATDAGNIGWFSRCQFYVEPKTGTVLQTPLRVGNVRERSGRAKPTEIRVQLDKELPARFRMPGRQQVSEQAVYAILYNFLNALVEVGVAVCGRGIVQPLAGRHQGPRAGT